jgi:hypothetical protein
MLLVKTPIAFLVMVLSCGFMACNDETQMTSSGSSVTASEFSADICVSGATESARSPCRNLYCSSLPFHTTLSEMCNPCASDTCDALDTCLETLEGCLAVTCRSTDNVTPHAVQCRIEHEACVNQLQDTIFEFLSSHLIHAHS